MTDTISTDPAEDTSHKVEHADILKSAQENLELGLTWESTARQRFIQDLRFAEADSENGYQWPDKYKKERQLNDRPCLTINKVRQHNLLIINDAKQNKPGIAVRPTGNEATYEAAQVWAAIMRKIEYQSAAQEVYDQATGFQVKAGVGYWRVVTRYIDAESFDQDAYIEGIADPLTVVIDNFAKKPDKSDMQWAIIFEDIKKEQAQAKYGKMVNLSGTTLGMGLGLNQQDSVRIAEYYWIEEIEDTLWRIQDNSNPDKPQEYIILESLLDKELIDHYKDDPMTETRPVKTKKVRWVFFIGSELVEEKEWLGSEIPVIQLLGEECVVDGIMDRKGHTRALIDPQRMYNYWSSSAVEYGALQTKTPWLAAAEALDGYTDDWAEANVQNKAVLQFNALSENGEAIPPPERIAPPMSAPVALDGLKIAQMEMMLVSGQYEAQFGQESNERSGKAINERQRQGDRATYHFIDNLGIAIRRTGKILLEIIPKLYNTKRVIMALGEDGESFEVTIDPQAHQAFQQRLDADNRVAQRILNPRKGKYDVYADVGPAYATKREEAFNAFTLILTQAPQLAAIIGDLLLKAGDFPMSDEAAQRLKRMVPPQALGQGPTQAEQQLGQQLQQLQQLYAKSLEHNANDKLKLKGHAEKRDVEIFNAVTQRLKLLVDHNQFTQDQVFQVVRDAIKESQTADQALQSDANETQSQLGPAAHQSPANAAEDPLGTAAALLKPALSGEYLKIRHTVHPRDVTQAFLGANQ